MKTISLALTRRYLENKSASSTTHRTKRPRALCTLALTRRYLENKSARKGLSRRTKRKWDTHYQSVLNRIDQAFAEPPDAAADRAFAVYDASLTAAFAAHAAALASGTSPADAEAAYSDSASSAVDAYFADISSV